MGTWDRKYECSVYQVKVVISQVGGYNPNKPDTEYIREENVLAVSEEAAVKKVERQFKWDLRDKLKDKDFVINHEVKLLVENVTY